MAKSIMQLVKVCYICDTTQNLEEHHCLHGTANRKLADKYGLVVWLCPKCHRGNNGVHFNKQMDEALKRHAQMRFENVHGTREDFLRIFGRNYL